MANIEYPYIRCIVIEAKKLKDLFELLSDEPRPFEMVVHPPIGKTGTRAVTIRAATYEDAKYFSDILKKLSKKPYKATYNNDKD